MIILTGEATGRLLRYDPATGSAPTVLASGLSFPNGVALSADGTHVVVAETTRCRLLRHWLRGPAAGTTEPFADLPGYPASARRRWVPLLGGAEPGQVVAGERDDAPVRGCRQGPRGDWCRHRGAARAWERHGQ